MSTAPHFGKTAYVPPTVLDALWESGIIDDSRARVMPVCDEDEMHVAFSEILLEQPAGLAVAQNDRTRRALIDLANYCDDGAEHHGNDAETRAWFRRLRSGIEKFLERLR